MNRNIRCIALVAVLAAAVSVGQAGAGRRRVPLAGRGRRKATTSCATFISSRVETLPELRMHYMTLGKPVKDANGRVTKDAVLILHGTGGDRGVSSWLLNLQECYSGRATLDVNRYFIIIPDNIGHGKSSKPSDGMRTHFPNTLCRHGGGAIRFVRAGTRRQSFSPDSGHFDGMHALVGLGRDLSRFHGRDDAAGLPTVELAGRNRIWRKMVIDGIRQGSGVEGRRVHDRTAGRPCRSQRTF